MADTNTGKQEEQGIQNKEAQNPKEAQNVCNVNVPAIIAALHQKALAEATKKVTNCRIANSAIEDDGKTAKLKSAGEHIITVFSKDKDEKILKTDALIALKEYVHWFVGPDLESKVKDDIVMPLDDEEQKQEGSESKPEDEKESEEKKEQVNASLMFPKFYKFLQSLNEATDERKIADSEIKEGSDVVDSADAVQKDTDEKKTKEQEKNDDTTGKDPEENAGYYIVYSLKVQGLKETKIKDAISDLAKGIFDSLTITASGLFGGGASFTGKDVRKKLHELKNIDAGKLAKDVGTFLKKKYPDVTQITAYERDGKTLFNELKSEYNNQLSKEQKSAITEAPFSVCVKIQEKDAAKPFINASKIAEAIRKCMSFFKLGSKMKVDADSIITITNYVDKKNKEQPDAEKRPTYERLKTHILHKLNDEGVKDLKNDPIDYMLGFDLFSWIKDVFQKLRSHEKAMKQDENIQAVKVFDDWEKKKGKEFNDKNHKFNYEKDFEPFLDAYEKLSDRLKKESVSLTKTDIANMLFESVFSSKEKLSQYLSDAKITSSTLQSNYNKFSLRKEFNYGMLIEDDSSERSSTDSTDDENFGGNKNESDGTVLYIYPIKNSEQFDDVMED